MEKIINQGTVEVKKPFQIQWFDEDDGWVRKKVIPGTYEYRVLNVRGWKPRQLKIDGEWQDVSDTCAELEKVLSEGKIVTVSKDLIDKTRNIYQSLENLKDAWLDTIKTSNDIADVRLAVIDLFELVGGRVHVDVQSPTYCRYDGKVQDYTIGGSASLKSYLSADLNRLVEDLTQAYFSTHGGKNLFNTYDLIDYIVNDKTKYVDDVVLEDSMEVETTTVANIAPTVDYLGHVQPIQYLSGDETSYESEYDNPDDKKKKDEEPKADDVWVSPIGRLVTGESVRKVVLSQLMESQDVIKK